MMKSRKLLFSEWMTIISVFIMLSGFLFSRFLLTTGMILLLLNALNPANIQENIRIWRKSRFALYCGIFFFVFFLSGIWSENTDAWIKDVQVKLPFLILPFGMMGANMKSNRMKDIILYLVLGMLLFGIVYSLFLVFQDPSFFLRGEHILGPVDNDYLRFTLALVLGINIVFYLLEKKGTELKLLPRLLFICWAIIAAVYLHIQASKLGLLAFYVLLGVYSIYFLSRKSSNIRGVKKIALVLIGILILVFFSLKLPTIQNQIEKTNFEKEALEGKNTEFAGGSFSARIISYKAGLRIIAKHPILGVGSGDWKENMEKEYQANYPQLKNTLIPHNEFIFTMLAVGIPLSMIFWVLLLSPLFRSPQIAEIATVFIMLCGTMVEAFLEIQFGIFVYLFFTLIWSSLRQKENLTAL